MLSVAGQCVFFLCTFLLGGLGGVCFDVYRRLRARKKPRPPWGSLWDLIFWLLMLGLAYGYLLLTLHGDFRLSVAGALFAGAWFYIYKKK